MSELSWMLKEHVCRACGYPIVVTQGKERDYRYYCSNLDCMYFNQVEDLVDTDDPPDYCRRVKFEPEAPAGKPYEFNLKAYHAIGRGTYENMLSPQLQHTTYDEGLKEKFGCEVYSYHRAMTTPDGQYMTLGYMTAEPASDVQVWVLAPAGDQSSHAWREIGEYEIVNGFRMCLYSRGLFEGITSKDILASRLSEKGEVWSKLTSHRSMFLTDLQLFVGEYGVGAVSKWRKP